MHESSNFFSLAAFQIKYNLQVRPLTFFGLISAVNRLLRKNTKTKSEPENRFSKFSMSQKPSKFIYKEIVSKYCERLISCKKKKWCKDINLPPKEIINWKVAYQHTFNAQRAVNLSFSTSNSYIAGYFKQVGLRDDDKCSFCYKEKENLMHLLKNNETMKEQRKIQ